MHTTVADTLSKLLQYGNCKEQLGGTVPVTAHGIKFTL